MATTSNGVVVGFLSVLFLFSTRMVLGQMKEAERLEEYHKRNYTWFPKKLLPDTEGWKRNFYRRFEQVGRIDDAHDRYNAYRESVRASITTKNFTEFGWGVTRAPPVLLDELKQALYDGLASDKKRIETVANVIDGSERPWFFPIKQLNRKTLETLKPLHEQWIGGIPLIGSLAYGLRVYRNNSALYMHVDKPMTHVISCILHIDHSEDSEPWPIFIEDYAGNTNEVVLESGDMLFYESSKCIHGRPRKFNGSWYSSVFVHYYPVGWNDDVNPDNEAHYAVPPNWIEIKPDDGKFKKLEMRGTSMIEPDCPDSWCSTIDTVKWNGPARDGHVITAGGKEFKLFPAEEEKESNEEL